MVIGPLSVHLAVVCKPSIIITSPTVWFDFLNELQLFSWTVFASWSFRNFEI